MPSSRRGFLKRSLAAAAWGGLGSDAAEAAGGETPQDQVAFQRRIPVRHTVDVFALDGTDERSIPRGLIAARKSLVEYQRYYQRYLPGFGQMELVATTAQLGVRESRRIMGDYVLNLEDFKSRATFPDEIGRYSYAVDIHAAQPDLASYQRYAKDFRELRYGKGESYGIPYRSLVPRKLRNVLVAGRCISTDRYVQSSIRVMPGCFITGQAIGVAAALAVQQGCDARDVPTAELQRRLKAMGGYLPNA